MNDGTASSQRSRIQLKEQMSRSLERKDLKARVITERRLREQLAFDLKRRLFRCRIRKGSPAQSSIAFDQSLKCLGATQESLA
jgi:hypothetical protein